MGDNRAARSSCHCSRVANRLNTIQVIRYPEVNNQAGATVDLSLRAFLTTEAYISTAGATDGSIIPTIITDHMINMDRKYAASQGGICIMFIVPPV